MAEADAIVYCMIGFELLYQTQKPDILNTVASAPTMTNCFFLMPVF